MKEWMRTVEGLLYHFAKMASLMFRVMIMVVVLFVLGKSNPNVDTFVRITFVICGFCYVLVPVYPAWRRLFLE